MKFFQVRSQDIIKPPDVQQIRGITYHQSSSAGVVQHRPITVNIVRVMPPRYGSSSLDSPPAMNVSFCPCSIFLALF